MSLPAGACLALRLHSRLEIDTSLRGLDLFGEVGRAFNAPTLDQLYDPRPLPGPEGDFALSNPALVPQRSRGWEVGLRGRTLAFEGWLVAYRLIVGNEIDFDPASFRYANIGRSRHQGVEASGRLEAGRFGVLYAAYARSEAEAEGAFPSAQLKNFPRDVCAWPGAAASAEASSSAFSNRSSEMRPIALRH